jgi:Zn-dependent protease/predicted transcriptional regulator
MFGKRVPLIRLFGFEVRFDLSWLILVALIVWTLSAGYFPGAYADLSASTYFWMGVLGAIGLIASIVLHELSHSLVARRFGIEIRGITLFVFGGAAEMTNEPPSPRAEFVMAVAGPVASLVLAAIFYLLRTALDGVGFPAPLVGVLGYLAGINVILAVFNLMPAFPLDGGRMLRAVLWGWRGDLRWATRIAANIGGGFGLALILLGVLNVVGGNLIGGMWYFLIGLFVRAAAASSYQQLMARETLGGVPVSRFMRRDPLTVTPDTRVSELVEAYFLQHYLKLVPVVETGRLLGLVDVRAAKAVPRETWAERRVADIMAPISADNTISPGTDAIKALELIQRTGQSRLLVAEGDHLVGIVALKDMLNALTMRLDFPDLPQSRHGALAGR